MWNEMLKAFEYWIEGGQQNYDLFLAGFDKSFPRSMITNITSKIKNTNSDLYTLWKD